MNHPLRVCACFIAALSVGSVQADECGSRWADVDLGLTAVTSLTLDGATPPRLYAGTTTGIFARGTAGDWAEIRAVRTGNIPDYLIADPTRTGVVYLAERHSRESIVAKTQNGGQDWVELLTLDAGQSGGMSLALSIAEPGVVYSSDHGTFRRSDDGGQTWQERTPPWEYVFLAVHPTQPGTVYALGGGAYRSEDRGETWVEIEALADKAVNAFATDPTGRIQYAATYSGNVYYSEDGGALWDASEAFSPSYLTALAVDARDPGVVYAGSRQHGVFRSTDGARTWAPCSEGMDNLDVLSLAIDHAGTGRLYAGTTTTLYQTTVPTAIQQTPSAPDTASLKLLPVHPNPSNSSTTIRFELSDAAPVDVGIYDLLGRRVVSLARDLHGAGQHTIRWNGRDGDGRDAATGTYLVRIVTGGASPQQQTRKLLLLR